MAMVRQLTESKMINDSTPEDENHMSDTLESFNSHSASHSSSGSKRNSPVYMPSIQYSKEDLMKYSALPLAKNRPSCLDPLYNNPSGKWDPERWFMNHRSDRLTSDESRTKRERQDEGIVSHKRKSSDPKERIKEEKDDIVLSPQRRSFGTGCHVIQQSSLARRPGSPIDSRESDNFRDPSRRIGSGRIMTRDRDQRDWERDREYGYGSGRNERRDRYDQEDNEKDRRYSNRYNRNDRRSRGRDRIDEVEPEWFSSGPTSQSETIELVGFEDSHNDDDNRKQPKKNKRGKQNSRRSSLKSEEGEKIEPAPSEEPVSQQNSCITEEDLPSTESKSTNVESNESNKSNNTGFDLNDMFRTDWLSGLLENESPPNTTGNEIGCSRFSQWFQRESPRPESQNNSRRSSLHDELIIANVLNSIVDPPAVPSPPQSSSGNFFAPISPAMAHSNYSASQQNESSCNPSKDIMEMLQSANCNADSNLHLGNFKDSTKAMKELEADLKRIVLGDRKQEDRSAFEKLLQHMSESRNSPASSLSMGPLDKSKALQEQDLLQDMLGEPQTAQPSPMIQSFQMFKDDKPNSQISPGLSHNQFNQHNQTNQSEILAHLLQQQKHHEQHLSHVQQQQHLQMQQLQSHLQQQQSQNLNVQGYTVDMLAKMLGTSSQPQLSPASPGLQNASANANQNDPLNPILQYHRQQEMLSSLLKQQQQQQQQQQHSGQNLSQANLLQSMQRRSRPSTKEVPIQQALGLPSLGISPRHSPLPPDSINSALPSQGRIPSPLVFGQQPPALSHAPAPIHPAALVQAMAQQNANSNTLQVQNPVVLQRVPSPQELAVHTQSILQNALIKRKLEEQKENFRKRQEAQRTNSPVSNKNGMSASPLKGLSPTIALTPTSVMRKIQSEKAENKEQKSTMVQNGNKLPGDSKLLDSLNAQKMNSVSISTSTECSFGLVSTSNSVTTQNSTTIGQAPRALHGQANSQPRSIHGSLNSVGSMGIPNQGRPIVKVGMNQNVTSEMSRSSIPSKVATHKQFLSGVQAHNLIENDPNFESVSKFSWQHQLMRPQNTSSMPQLQMAAAATAYAALNHRPSAINPHHPSLLRPVGIGSSGNIPAPNLNFPLLRNTAQNPIRAQANSISQLSNLGLALQMQRNPLDSRQLQALAQSQRLHPAALQQILMNSQNQVTAAQAQVAAGFSGNRDKHQHLLPGQSSTNRQSPVNLAKWFGSDVLKQKMPEMPPVSHQKALLVEEIERQQTQSAAVHN